MALKRYFGFSEETTFGKASAAKEYIDPESVELDPSGEQAIIFEGASRMDRLVAPGHYRSEGSVSFPVDLDTIGYFLKWVLGGYDVKGTSSGETGTKAPYTHTFTPSMDNLLPSFTARVGKDIFEHVFTSCVLSSLSLELEDGFLMANADILGGKDETATLKKDVKFTDGEVFAPHEVTISMGGQDESTTIQSFSLNIENGADMEAGHTIGTRFPRLAFRGAMLVELEVNLLFFDTKHIETFWGQAKGPIEEGELKDIDTQINIGDNFTIDIPSAIISEIEQPLGGREHIEQTATLRGLLTRDGEGPISVEIINDKESY